jgi:hypothetical protein
MKRWMKASTLALAMVVMTATAALACHVTTKSASLNCEGAVAWSVTADAARSNQIVKVSIDGSEVAVKAANPSASGSATGYDPTVGHTVGFKLYWNGNLEDTETTTAAAAQGCEREYPYSTWSRMRPEGTPLNESGSFLALPGESAVVSLTRAPRFLRATIKVDGSLVYKVKVAATPGRTTLGVKVGGIEVEKYARLAGRDPKTFTYSTVL